MPATARKERDTAIGLIISGRTSVIVNNSPIACEGDVIAPHTPAGVHNGSVIVGHTKKVVAENAFVARESDPTSCGHAIMSGSGNVISGD